MTDWWQDRPWRLIQTNLREIDMRDIRAARVVADLQAFKANVLMINAAGIIASYPTQLPFQFQSPYLSGDSLRDIIAACHAADIRVIARTDSSKVRRPIYEQHPDWAYISPQGQIVDYNGDVHVCINGPYQQEYALRIIEELLGTHDFDGIFFNMGGYQTRDYSGNYYGICHCVHCQRKFSEMFGMSYFRFTPDRSMFPRLAETDLVYMDGAYVYARYAPNVTLHMQLIPLHKFGPPERCYYEQVTDYPGFSVHPFGQGQALYLPWSPGALFHRRGHVNTAYFCADLLQGVAGLAPVAGNLPPQVEVTLFENANGGGLLLHLVNGSGHFGNSFCAPVTMTDIDVVVPCAQQPMSVRALRAGQKLDYTWANGHLTVRVPRLDLFEAIEIGELMKRGQGLATTGQSAQAG